MMPALSRRAALLATALLAFAIPALGAGAPARTVLVTGANRGIGLEFVRQYSALGWKVIATTRDPGDAKELNAFAKDHPNVVVEKLDLLDHPGIDALAKKYAGQPVDVLVNNAGLMRGPDKGQMVGSIDYAEFDRFYRTNAMGPLKVAEAFYPNVKAGELKVMAALTTGKGKRGIPVPGFTLYKTSKAALDAIQQEIALRWKNQGIKVVTLNPGRVLTHGEPAGPGQATVPIGDSIRGMIGVLDRLTMEQSGTTIQWDGERLE
ncbi:MAG: SDR family oxidoreductase [Gammaproteobacteria bacterium]|nr:SDR family oxidoreductase [Gammaproteobacteria bacterium]